MNADDRYRTLIKAIMEKRGISVNALAKVAGISEAGLRGILSGTVESTTVARLDKIAKGLGLPVAKFFEIDADLLSLGDASAMTSHFIPTGSLVVAGSVQAGVWHEEEPMDPDAEAETIPVGRDPRFPPELRQFALKVKGESINQIAKDGQYVCCVDVTSYREFVDKDIAVVVRHRDGGALWEATVKQIEIGKDGKVALWPRSDDPRYQTPIFLDEDDKDTHFELKALVVGVYRSLI